MAEQEIKIPVRTTGVEQTAAGMRKIADETARAIHSSSAWPRTCRDCRRPSRRS